MDSNELRALADALEPMSGAPRFEGMNVLAFCKWLRAQAEAQPVGYATANGLRMLQQDDATVLLYKHDYLIRPDHVPLYAHPAPAVPQAEPCIGNDPICPCQDGDACHYKDAADGTKAWPIPQAEQRPDGWQVVPVVPTKSMNSAGLSAVNQYGKRSVWETYRAMLAAAPNVPQAEPDDDDDALVLGEPDILTPEDLRRLVPQTEPKREPWSGYDEGHRAGYALAQAERELSEKQIADACYRYRHDFGLLDKYERDCIVNEARRWAEAFGIGGSDERR